MNIRMKRFAFAMVVALCAALVSAMAQKAATHDAKITVGGTEIVVPLAAGYEDMAQNEAFVGIMEKYIPPQVRMQLFAMHGDDLAHPDFEHPNEHPMIMVGSPTSLEKMEFTEAAWKLFRPMILAQMQKTDIGAASKKLMDEGNARMAKAGVDMRVDPGSDDVPKPEIWQHADGSIRTFLVDNGGVRMLGQEVKTQQDVGVVMMPVRNRLLAFYIYVDRPSGKSDPAAMRKLMDDFVLQLRARNP